MTKCCLIFIVTQRTKKVEVRKWKKYSVFSHDSKISLYYWIRNSLFTKKKKKTSQNERIKDFFCFPRIIKRQFFVFEVKRVTGSHGVIVNRFTGNNQIIYRKLSGSPSRSPVRIAPMRYPINFVDLAQPLSIWHLSNWCVEDILLTAKRKKTLCKPNNIDQSREILNGIVIEIKMTVETFVITIFFLFHLQIFSFRIIVIYLE